MTGKILLIEDDLFIRDLYKHVLTLEGYSIQVALDGKQGFEASLRKPSPDLILLDIMLPKMNGVDVLRLIKSHDKTKNIPVIMLTNLGDETVIETTRKIGASDYLLKANNSPYEIRDKVNAVFRSLQNK